MHVCLGTFLATGSAGGATPPDYKPTFVVEGDSRTALGTASPWPTQLRTALPALGATNYVNAAVSGETVATMVGQYASQIAPHHSQRGTFILMAGINDRALSADTVIAANIQTIAASAKSGFGRTYIALENIRNMGSALVLGRVNNLLLDAQYSSPIASALIAPHCLLSTTADFLAADQLHPSAAGNTKIAAFVQKLITESAETVTPLDPISATGIQLAVDISDLTTILNSGGTPCTNGQTVDRWNDRSGNANHLTATLDTKPIFDTSNPLRVIFNVSSLTTAGNFVKSNPFTVYGLLHDTKTAGTIATWWADNRTFVSRPSLFDVFGAPCLGVGPGHSAGYYASMNTISHRCVFCAIFDGTTGKFYIDGKLVWTDTIVSVSCANKTVLGGLAGVSTLAFAGAIGGFSFHTGAHDHTTVRRVSKWYADLGKTYFYPYTT